MPDICKCSGEGCPVKEKCYRYTSKPSYYQSYFTKAPIKNNKCEYYWGDNAKGIWDELKFIMNKP
jgi:hypothetical protein